MSIRTISGIIRQPVHVAPGERVRLVANGVVQGEVTVEGHFIVDQQAAVQGVLRIEAGGTAQVDGAVQGTLFVDPDGEVSVTARGKIQGLVENHGIVTVRGVFGGDVIGDPLDFVDGGRSMQPTIRDGSQYFDM